MISSPTSRVLMLALMALVAACSSTMSDQVGSSLGTSSESSLPQLRILNAGDLAYLDKLLLQRERATEAHKQEAAEWLVTSQAMAAEDVSSDYAQGYSDITKMHCPSAMIYPTNEALIMCAESEVLFDIDFEGTANRFRGSSRLYHTILAFSEAVDEPLSPQQRQSVEANIKCLDSFLENAVTPSPTCQLLFTTLR